MERDPTFEDALVIVECRRRMVLAGYLRAAMVPANDLPPLLEEWRRDLEERVELQKRIENMITLRERATRAMQSPQDPVGE